MQYYKARCFMKKQNLVIPIVLIAILTACSAQNAAPTFDSASIQTAAVETIIAEITITAEYLATENAPTATEAFTATPSYTATPEITTTPAPCADSAWVQDVTIPDGSLLKPGEKFTKTWKIKNTGSCTWVDGYYLIYGYGEKLGGATVAIPGGVAPETEIEVSIDLTAPSKTGNYFSWWRLKNEWGIPFGQFFGVTFTVQ